MNEFKISSENRAAIQQFSELATRMMQLLEYPDVDEAKALQGWIVDGGMEALKAFLSRTLDSIEASGKRAPFEVPVLVNFMPPPYDYERSVGDTRVMKALPGSNVKYTSDDVRPEAIVMHVYPRTTFGQIRKQLSEQLNLNMEQIGKFYTVSRPQGPFHTIYYTRLKDTAEVIDSAFQSNGMTIYYEYEPFADSKPETGTRVVLNGLREDAVEDVKLVYPIATDTSFAQLRLELAKELKLAPTQISAFTGAIEGKSVTFSEADDVEITWSQMEESIESSYTGIPMVGYMPPRRLVTPKVIMFGYTRDDRAPKIIDPAEVLRIRNGVSTGT